MSKHYFYIGHFCRNPESSLYATVVTPKYHGLTLEVEKPIDIECFEREVGISWEKINNLSVEYRPEGYLVGSWLGIESDMLNALKLILSVGNLDIVGTHGEFVLSLNGYI